MGPVRQNPIQRTVGSVHMCAVRCVQLLHTILHRTDLILFHLALQTITTAPMMSMYYKFTAKSDDEIILRIDQHLAGYLQECRRSFFWTRCTCKSKLRG